jgi:hypothetical protein
VLKDLISDMGVDRIKESQQTYLTDVCFVIDPASHAERSPALELSLLADLDWRLDLKCSAKGGDGLHELAALVNPFVYKTLAGAGFVWY